jgi:glycosyltransferase involved in cell wall biosynthesis
LIAFEAGEMIDGLVSTIIPVYNRPLMVERAVESVLAQTHRPVEIIVVDDGSTDETPRVLERLAGANPGIIQAIRRENGGPGLARETGRLAARGEFIQYLDSDDWLLPEKFSIQVQLLRDHPECGIAYGITHLVDEEGAILAEASKWTGRRLEFLFPGLLVDRWWHTSTPLYRRTVSDAAGPWPSRRPEDWDLEARMGADRVKLAYSATPVSCHLEHASPNRVTRGDAEAYHRDEAWFLPRLYDCAIRAGVGRDTPEMQHFSRWAFMRARYLGALGEPRLAAQLLALSKDSAPSISTAMRAVELAAKIWGWKLTGLLCGLWDRYNVDEQRRGPGRILRTS